MERYLSTLADNVRRIREEKGLSLGQLAEQCGVSKATLFKIERATTNPTLDTILALAEALALPIESLIEPVTVASVDVVRRNEGQPTDDGTELVKAMVSGSIYLEFHRLDLAAGTSVTRPAREAGTRQHVFVLSGRVRVGPNDEQAELRPGDYALYDADHPHGFVAGGRVAARAWVITTQPRQAPRLL